jgi:hypothetical protein
MTSRVEGEFGTDAAASGLWQWLAIGFVSGALGVLVFHQGANLITYSLGWTPNPPYQMRATWPLGVPQVLSLAFWGGVWAMVLALILRFVPQLPRAGVGLAIAGFVFGAFIISPFNWFVLAPLRGQPLGNGFVLANMVRGQIYNGIFGLGAGVCLPLLQRLMTARR